MNEYVSAFGVVHEISKREKKASMDRHGATLAANALTVPGAHGVFAGKKGKKARAAGNEFVGGAGGALAGGPVGAMTGSLVGRAATRGSVSGQAVGARVGSTLGGLAGFGGGTAWSVNRNQRKGYYKPER